MNTNNLHNLTLAELLKAGVLLEARGAFAVSTPQLLLGLTDPETIREIDVYGERCMAIWHAEARNLLVYQLQTSPVTLADNTLQTAYCVFGVNEQAKTVTVTHNLDDTDLEGAMGMLTKFAQAVLTDSEQAEGNAPVAVHVVSSYEQWSANQRLADLTREATTELIAFNAGNPNRLQDANNVIDVFQHELAENRFRFASYPDLTAATTLFTFLATLTQQ